LAKWLGTSLQKPENDIERRCLNRLQGPPQQSLASVLPIQEFRGKTMSNPIKIPGWPDAFTPQMPGFSNKSDSAGANPFMGLDFMKNLWGSSLPSGATGFVVPSFDLDDLDKRIKDLKAVQSWLDVNASMLNATIQGLEVQRNTIAAIQAIGGSMGNKAAEFFRQGADAGASAEKEKPKTSAEPDWGAIAPGWPNPAPGTSADTSGEPQGKANDAEPGAAAQPMPATAWLGFMQDQFNKIAAAAVAPVSPGAAPGSATNSATNSATTARPARSAQPDSARATRKPAAAARKSGAATKTTSASVTPTESPNVNPDSMSAKSKAAPRGKKAG